jgi:dipeptidyl aminopeptidase/acylaminoacyl peptidase
MTDLRRRFEQLDRVPAPDLRLDIRTRPPGQPPSRFSWGRLGTAALAFAVAAAGIAFAARAFLGPPVGRSTAAPGGKIAFARGGDIFVVDSDGTGLSQLTDTEAHESSPAWAPDGTRIAYVVTDGSRETSEIRVLNADGSLVMRLTTELAGSDLPTWSDWPTWSPDGTRLVFGGYGDHGYEIYITGLDGTGLRRLTDEADNGVDGAHMPAWSPDGTRIAYSANRYDPATQTETQAIHVMNPDGTDHEQLTDGSAIDEAPAWSPDGARIAFSRKVDGNSEIYIMNADGTSQRNLTSNPAEDGDPTWAPDGGKIAFGSYREGIHGVYVMGADGTEVSTLADHAVDPFWQPAGPEAQVAPSPEPTHEAIERGPTVTIPLAGMPEAIAATEGSVWVSVRSIEEPPTDPRLVRIDQATNEIEATIPLGMPVWELAAAPGAVWGVGHDEDGLDRLVRVNPATNEVVATVHLDDYGGPLVADASGVWALTAAAQPGGGEHWRLVKVSAASNRIEASTPIDAYVDEMALADRSVWLMQWKAGPAEAEACGPVIRIDAATLDTIETMPAGGLNLAAGPGAVWISCRQDPQGTFVARWIDTATSSVSEPIPLPHGAGPAGVVEEGAWFSGYDAQERVRVFFTDEGTHEISGMVRLQDGYYTGAAFDPATSTIWIAHTSTDGSAIRIDLDPS